jgi:hypothetical protein
VNPPGLQLFSVLLCVLYVSVVTLKLGRKITTETQRKRREISSVSCEVKDYLEALNMVERTRGI